MVGVALRGDSEVPIVHRQARKHPNEGIFPGVQRNPGQTSLEVQNRGYPRKGFYSCTLHLEKQE